MRLAVIPATVVLVAAACGGDAAPGLVQYYARLEDISVDVRARQQQADSEYDAILSAETYSPDVRSGFADYLREQRDVARQYAESAADLRPPEEARALHEAAISAYAEFADEMDTVIGAVTEAQTLDQLVGALGSPDAVVAAVRATEACVALQELADREGVEADLRCQE